MSLKRQMSKVLALPVLLAAAIAFSAPAYAQTPAQEAPRKTGTAIKDTWITMKVHSQFVPENALEGSDIDVDTRAGVVTLNGTVVSEAGRARAMAIAKATDGVVSVTNNLRIAAAADMTAAARDAAREAGRKTGEVAGTTGRAVSDGWLKSKIAAKYVTENSLDNSDIDIDITKGAVVLNGAVRTAAARDRAAAIAKETEGVKSVTNNLKVDPSVR